MSQEDRTEPLVSIIIPTFNRGELLKEAINSIAEQSNYWHWEILVMDDCSTDTTAEIVEQIKLQEPRVQFFRSSAGIRKGANYCRNRGVSLARGEYVVFLDSDDLFVKDKLRRQIELLSANENLNCCVSFAELFSTDNSEIVDNVWVNKPQSSDTALEIIRKNIRWPISGPMWRKSFLGFDPFDERIQAGQDFEFHVRMALKMQKEEMVVLDAATVLVRISNTSISRNRKLDRFLEYIKGRCHLVAEVPMSVVYKRELLKSVESSYIKLKLAGYQSVELQKYEDYYREVNGGRLYKMKVFLRLNQIRKKIKNALKKNHQKDSKL
ncbi:glycosyltransferase family 2 protein [Lewinella sp. W8]|uniref:glycosyltransferase family 2 protein n=1 Tax=Lewinella sp. W8 TaxID=2528208 RepID=UPI0010689204|nr:glycosyltransferase [Lewinella sp. W8]